MNSDMPPFIAFIYSIQEMLKHTFLRSIDTGYDTTRVLIQENMATEPPYAEIIEYSPQYGKIKLYKSVIILNKGIIIILCPNYKIRISQCDNNNQCALMLMNSDYKFIDLDMPEFPKYYSKLEPKIINIYKLGGEINFLLMLLAPAF